MPALLSCVVFAMALLLSLLSLTFRGQGSICYKLPTVQSVSHNLHLMEENFRSVLPRHSSGPEGEWREVSCLFYQAHLSSIPHQDHHPSTHSQGEEHQSAPPPADCVALSGFDCAQTPIADMHNVFLL